MIESVLKNWNEIELKSGELWLKHNLVTDSSSYGTLHTILDCSGWWLLNLLYTNNNYYKIPQEMHIILYSTCVTIAARIGWVSAWMNEWVSSYVGCLSCCTPTHHTILALSCHWCIKFYRSGYSHHRHSAAPFHWKKLQYFKQSRFKFKAQSLFPVYGLHRRNKTFRTAPATAINIFRDYYIIIIEGVVTAERLRVSYLGT